MCIMTCVVYVGWSAGQPQGREAATGTRSSYGEAEVAAGEQLAVAGEAAVVAGKWL
jgi:hypothetical protein